MNMRFKSSGIIKTMSTDR